MYTFTAQIFTIQHIFIKEKKLDKKEKIEKTLRKRKFHKNKRNDDRNTG